MDIFVNEIYLRIHRAVRLYKIIYNSVSSVYREITGDRFNAQKLITLDPVNLLLLQFSSVKTVAVDH